MSKDDKTNVLQFLIDLVKEQDEKLNQIVQRLEIIEQTVDRVD